MRFRATIELGGKTATGIEVPSDVVTALGESRRPAVAVTLGEHTFRTTVNRMAGRFMIPVSAADRTAAGVAAGDEVEVDVVLDDAPRETTIPADLDAVLDETSRAHFETLAPSHRKEWVRWIEEAKKPETRAVRIEKAAAALRDGRKTR